MALWSWKSVLSRALRVTTLLSSLATVILFIVFLVDRTDLENIRAWQILQGYKGGDNVGLTFALETLVRNYQSLRHLDLPGRPLRLDGADLRCADMKFAKFGFASFEATRLDHANLADSVVAYSGFQNCRCRGTDFSNSFLEQDSFDGADLDRAKFDSANLLRSDFSKMKYRRRGWGSNLPANPDQFAISCWDVSIPDGSVAEVPSTAQIATTQDHEINGI
jgi:hypothetical protein